MTDEQTPLELLRPVEIELSRSAGLRVRWSDGAVTSVGLAVLRENCPCATCRDRRQQREKQQSPLRVIPGGAEVSQQIAVESAELVGNYALRIRWRDGHDTGIYSYGLLRALGER
jgi:DUF971 family protein